MKIIFLVSIKSALRFNDVMGALLSKDMMKNQGTALVDVLIFGNRRYKIEMQITIGGDQNMQEAPRLGEEMEI